MPVKTGEFVDFGFLFLALAGAVTLFALFVFWIEPLWLLPALERVTPNIVYRVRTSPLVALNPSCPLSPVGASDPVGS